MGKSKNKNKNKTKTSAATALPMASEGEVSRESRVEESSDNDNVIFLHRKKSSQKKRTIWKKKETIWRKMLEDLDDGFVPKEISAFLEKTLRVKDFEERKKSFYRLGNLAPERVYVHLHTAHM